MKNVSFDQFERLITPQAAFYRGYAEDLWLGF